MSRSAAITAGLAILCLSASAFFAVQSRQCVCRFGDELSSDFYVAADMRETDLDCRLEAAAKLNKQEEAIVRRLLTRNLPNAENLYHFGPGLIDSIAVLGVVGDASTIPHLIVVIKANGAGSGKYNIAASRAIEAIEKKLAYQAVNAPAQPTKR